MSANFTRAPLATPVDRVADLNLTKRFHIAAATAKKVEAPTAPAAAGVNIPPKAPTPRGDSVAVEREFAHVHTPGLLADTLLWHPTLWLENGAGEVRFEVGSGQTTYRVLLLGHSPTGRLGIFETRLDATGAVR